MRTRLAWLVTLPIALTGVEAAHALANALLGAPSNADAEVFTGARPPDELTLTLVAVALGSVLLGLGARTAGAWWAPRRSRAVAVPFACLPPLAFVLLELLEGGLEAHAVPWDDFATPTFLCGLLLQLPFALGGYLVARALLSLSDRVRELVGRRQAPRRRRAPSVRFRRRDAPRPAVATLSGHLGRGPPREAPAAS